MYAQSFLVTSVRGIELLPITAASVELGVIGFMKEGFGLRPLFFFFAGLRATLRTFFAFLLLFFLFAITISQCGAGAARVVGNDN